MPNTLLYTVGNSDIKINDHHRFGDFLNTTKIVFSILERDKERAIVDQGFNLSAKETIQVTENTRSGLKTYYERLTNIELPILVPIMNGVMRDCHKKLKKVYLFGTEQKPPHDQDTIWAAEIMRLFIQDKYRILSEHITINKIDKSPFDYDQMGDYFAQFFEENSDLRKSVTNYISLTAGTPAETINIALRSMNLSVKYLYLPRDSRECKEVKLLSRLNRERYGSIIQELINNYQYGSAIGIVGESPYASNFQLLTLLEVMRKRLLFDFEGALKESRKLGVDKQSIRTRTLKYDLAELSQLNEQKILEELVYRVELSFRKKDYLEGIALLFSLIDNFLKYQFKASTGKKIEKVRGTFKEFNQFIQDHPYVEDKEKYIDAPNRPNLRKLLSLISENKSSINGIEEMNAFLDRLERPSEIEGRQICILDLRNLGPYAHGNMAVTEGMLRDIYSPFGAVGIINDLKKCIKPFCSSLADNPFDILNEIILGLLEIE